MKRLQMVFLAFFVMVAASAWAQNGAPLKLIHTIPVPGLHDGDFDHFMVNLPSHRLFLAAEENGKVIVMDTRTNNILHVITGLSSPHSMLLRADLSKLFVVDGDASEIKVYNSNTYQLIQHIPMTIDADSIAYDPATKYLYVVSGGRAAHTPYSFIEIVDTTSSKVIGKIKIDTNRIEALALEKSGPYIYANLTGENAVGEINRKTRSLVATWPISSAGKQNVALGYDEADHRLFPITREPGKFIVLNSQTGKMITSMPCVAFADDGVYNAATKRIYVPGTGYIYVFKQQDPDHYTLLAKVRGGSYRAKTAILVPELNRYYLAVPHHGAKEAEVRVYEVMP